MSATRWGLNYVLRPAVIAALIAACVPAAAQAAAGDFTSGGRFPAGNFPYDIAVADFNGDGTSDAAVANVTSNDVSVLLGDGAGRFKPAGPAEAAEFGPTAVAPGQFGGDSDMDLAVTLSTTDTVLVLIGRGDGRFRPAPGPPIDVGDTPFELAADDLNGDGDTDLAVVNESDDAVTILLGEGDGDFEPSGTSPEGVGDSPVDIVAADVNGGAPDLAVTNSGDDNISILLGDGTGGFNTPVSSPEAAGTHPIGIAAANLDAAGPRDLAVVAAGASPETHIMLGNGLGDFTAPMTSPEAEGTHDIAAADLDGDGDQDLAAAEFYGGEVALLLNDGAANFTKSPTSPTFGDNVPADLAVADLDDDGDEDLLTAGGQGIESLLNNEADGDSDGIADQADYCPTLAAPGGCPQLARTLSLRYAKRAGAFKGKIASDEAECAQDENVKIFRLPNAGGRKRVSAGTTNHAGRYRASEPAARGRYVAEAKPSTDPDHGTCVTATSETLRVR